MFLKLGSKGNNVVLLQEFLNIGVDGIFGRVTETAVKSWQSDNRLIADGIVGPLTWSAMKIDELATTDIYETNYVTDNGVEIEEYFLPKSEYITGPTNKEYLFLHHTAGWHNPYNVVDSWGRDRRGRVATEFVLGGQSIKGTDSDHDGKLLQCIPEGGYGWHLGRNGSRYMHTHSVGIEVNNFGYLTKGGYKKKTSSGKRIWVDKLPNAYYTYAGTEAHESQIVELSEPFRGYKYWHRYSDEQIETLRKFILYIADRDNIDIRQGLVREVKKNGAKGFEFNKDAYYGKIKGMWTHTNTRKDKFDMFPQPELLNMLTEL